VSGGEGGILRAAPLFTAILAAIGLKISRFKTLAASGSFAGFRRFALSCGLRRRDVTQNVTQAANRRFARLHHSDVSAPQGQRHSDLATRAVEDVQRLVVTAPAGELSDLGVACGDGDAHGHAFESKPFRLVR
jgi:hypothetical protein